MSKIEVTQAPSKSQESPEGTLGLLDLTIELGQRKSTPSK